MDAPPEWDLLLSAAQKNQPDRIKEMVRSGVSASHANGVGQTALHVAALWGNVSAVQALLESGANVHSQNNLTGGTPLHMVLQSRKAAGKELEETVELLLDFGADPSQTDHFGKLPVDYLIEHQPVSQLVAKLQPKAPEIFLAIGNRDVAQVKALLASKQEGIVTLEYKHQTPLSFAVTETAGSNGTRSEDEAILRIIKSLLHEKADPNYARTDLEDSFDPPLVQILRGLRECYNSDGQSSLLESVASELISGGAKIDSDVTAMLHNSARRNELRMVKFLIERLGLNPNVPNRQGMTALQFASRSGQMDVLKYLTGLSAIDIKVKDHQGQTALSAAQANGKTEAAMLLLKAAAEGS